MGSDPAPLMANLFLFHYEDKFMKSSKFSKQEHADFRKSIDLLMTIIQSVIMENSKDAVTIYTPQN